MNTTQTTTNPLGYEKIGKMLMSYAIPSIENCQINKTDFSLPSLHGQLADLPNGRGNFFLSPLHGIILAIFENAKNERKKTGNLF